MTNYIYIVIPVVYGYVMQHFCPFVDTTTAALRQQELEKTNMKRLYDVVWPLLFLMVGFSWYFARDKASMIEQLGQNVTKGSREAVKGFGKLFGKSSQTTALDTAFTLFTLFLGWWMVVHSCTTDKRNAMLVLFLTSVTGTIVLYLITSYGRKGLFSLIPVVLWMFFTNEDTIKDYLSLPSLPSMFSSEETCKTH